MILGLTAISCQKELEPSSRPLFDGEALTLVPRVKSFANQYVTKADDKTAYTDNEKKITRLAILVFDNNGNLIHIQEGGNDGGISSLSVNKSVLNTTTRAEVLDKATVVMFANISLDAIKKTVKDGVTSTIRDIEKLNDLGNYSYHFANSTTETDVVVTDLENNFKGFPMVGTATVDLRPTTTQQDKVSVNLKILYAKIIFNISVADGSENQSLIQNGPSFSLSGYSINNVAKVASYNEPTEGAATANNDYAYIQSSNPETTVTVSKTGTATKNSNPLEFTFYVAESRYNPKSDADGKIDLSGIYPSNDWLASTDNDDVKDYESLTDEQKAQPKNRLNGVKHFYDDLIQQYKPKLVNNGGTPKTDETGLATYVTVNGTYTDYRGTVWTVNYKIFLGKDNAHNFHVDRNSEYTNHLTIKGIRNNDSYGNGDVWIDHRVNVSTEDAAKHITITRETLIDSHIEVRPLRVKWDNENYSFARIYLPYYTENNGESWSQRDESTSSKKNWIGIELNDKTSSLHCSDDNGPSQGKRKYFTNNLIPELNTNTINTDIVSESGQDKFIILGNGSGVWIYIDEYIYTESSTSVIAAQDRTAKIVVEFCKLSSDGKSISVEGREEYILHQQPLITVDGANSNKYYIENYEEYLHSYNSHDKYNISTPPTDYTGQGLQWGNNSRMSKSQFVTKTVIANWAPTNNEAFDFLHSNDAAELSGYVFVDKDKNAIDLTQNTGLSFTNLGSANNGITIASMGAMPDNAYQYCLSKNKFIEGEDGESHTMQIHWYVPDVYELLDIFKSNASPLSNDNLYWSSQVPYDITQSNVLSATIASERENEARVVSKSGGQDTKPRSNKYRIRCLYGKDGVTADMSDRTPEGIGGLINIPMTVANNGFFNHNDWLVALGEIIEQYPDTTYKFPMGDTYNKGVADRDNADKDFGGNVINGVHYYSKYPIDQQNWRPDILKRFGDYYTLVHPNKWPGLTPKVTQPITDAKILEDIANWVGVDAICTISSTEDKKIERSVTVRSGRKIDGLPSNVTAIPLDHNEETRENLSISFGNGSNNKNQPNYKYYYEDVSAATKTAWEKKWETPKYNAQPMSGEDEIFTTGMHSLLGYTTLLIEKETMENDLEEAGYIIKSSTERTSGSGLRKQYYYEIIAYLSTDYYQYISGTGGWSEETKLTPEQVTITAGDDNVDALTIFAGNTFKIQAKDGYYIRSVKVNYNTSALTDTKYLRFINHQLGLPGENEEPEQMTYLDGANGWSKWTSEGNDSSIELRLVICDKNANSWWIGNWFGDQDMTHADPSTSQYSSEQDYSLIVNSLEIRLEERKTNTDTNQ